MSESFSHDEWELRLSLRELPVLAFARDTDCVGPLLPDPALTPAVKLSSVSTVSMAACSNSKRSESHPELEEVDAECCTHEDVGSG